MTSANRHASRTEEICDTLRTDIVQGRYPPGSKLRIGDIALSFTISSGAVREALSRLTAEGLVVARPQRGFLAAPVSRKDLLDLTEARLEIECLCLAASIRNATAAWEDRVRSTASRLRCIREEAGEPDSPNARHWHECHDAFHHALTDHCPNAWWMEIRQRVFLHSERYRWLFWSLGAIGVSDRDIVAEHDAISDAALARDVAGAVRHMRVHLERTAKVLLSADLPFGDAAAEDLLAS